MPRRRCMTWPRCCCGCVRRRKLPELLRRINGARYANWPGQRSVLLAVRLARHSPLDADNAAPGGDVREIATLLNLEAAVERLPCAGNTA